MVRFGHDCKWTCKEKRPIYFALLLKNLTSHDFMKKTVLIYFTNFYNTNELINGEYSFSIKTMSDNADKTQKLLEKLQKSDALDKKLTRTEDNLNTQIRDIKTNLESHKVQSKHEIDNIKNTLDDVEKSQDLILQRFEEQNIKIGKLVHGNKKMSMGNSQLNNKINNLIEQQVSKKSAKQPTRVAY